MSKKALLVMGIGVLVGLGAAVWAADRPQAGPDRERRLEELGLSQAQIDQLQELRSQERKAAVRRRADRAIARLELRDLLKADPVDENAVRAKVKQLATLEAAGAMARGEAALALRKIVSAEQAEKLLRERHHRRGGMRMGPGRRGPARHPGGRSEGRLEPGANDADADGAVDMAEAADEL